MSEFPWIEFLVLFGLAMIGVLAVIPYSLQLSGNKLAEVKLPRWLLLILSTLQNGLMMAIVTAIGLLAARAVNLHAPYIEAAIGGKPQWGSLVNMLPIAAGIGLLCFVFMFLLERFWFAPSVPEALKQSDVNTKAWMRFLASFYGGFSEEILTRLFLVSGLAWIIGLVWRNSTGGVADGAFWVAITLAAVLFGLGHLPTTKALTPLTPMIILRAVMLNGIAGIGFGWLFWQYGLEAAMAAHFTADILIHLVGPLLIGNVYGDQGLVESDRNEK